MRRAYFTSPKSINEVGNNIAGFELHQNYPNPFNPTTNVRFSIFGFGSVKLKVYDLLGEKMTTLVNEVMAPGSYEVQWDGKKENGEEAASGVYVYRLRAGKFVGGRKMLLVR